MTVTGCTLVVARSMFLFNLAICCLTAKLVHSFSPKVPATLYQLHWNDLSLGQSMHSSISLAQHLGSQPVEV